MRYHIDIGYKVNGLTTSETADQCIRMFASRSRAFWESSGTGFGIRDVQLECHYPPEQEDLDNLELCLRRIVQVEYISCGRSY